MSPVDFKKWPCHPVEFKGQGPQVSATATVLPWRCSQGEVTSTSLHRPMIIELASPLASRVTVLTRR